MRYRPIFTLKFIRFFSDNICIAFIWTSLIVVSSCESAFGLYFYPINPIPASINKYKESMDLVNLGDTKEKFIELVYDTQKNLPMQYTRPPSKYFKDDRIVEVFYVRSGWDMDNILTKRELTPYLFIDDVLVAIGWPSVEQFEN